MLRVGSAVAGRSYLPGIEVVGVGNLHGHNRRVSRLLYEDLPRTVDLRGNRQPRPSMPAKTCEIVFRDIFGKKILVPVGFALGKDLQKLTSFVLLNSWGLRNLYSKYEILWCGLTRFHFGGMCRCISFQSIEFFGESENRGESVDASKFGGLPCGLSRSDAQRMDGPV